MPVIRLICFDEPLVVMHVIGVWETLRRVDLFSNMELYFSPRENFCEENSFLRRK